MLSGMFRIRMLTRMLICEFNYKVREEKSYCFFEIIELIPDDTC